MKKTLALIALVSVALLILPVNVRASGGIFASGGGTKTVGQTFTVNVTASGATFDTVHGTISVSGPVSVVSFSAGDATWMSRPSNGGTFDGAFLGQKQTSFTVATIKLKGTGVGSGEVSVSGVALKNAGGVVGTGSDNASFTIQKAPDLPGAVQVASSSHPDQNGAYEATTISLNWNQEKGVDGFSYLLDQVADTTPAAKTTDAATLASYPDKAIGTYYFHIRAHKTDGWGGTTHFKINIKEPDAKINPALSAPHDIKIEKSSDFINNIKDGTVTGIIISGITEPGYTVNTTFTPVLTVPEGKILSAIADSDGKFQITLDFPISSGFHKIIFQGQKDKILTPISNEISFEISQAKGGNINILTTDDTNSPKEVKSAQKPASLKDTILKNKNSVYYGLLVLVPILLAIAVIIVFLRRSRLKNLGNIKIKN